jgi:hypothetical protein
MIGHASEYPMEPPDATHEQITQVLSQTLNACRCHIYSKALKYFATVWVELYGADKIPALKEYVKDLAYEWEFSEDVNGWRYEIQVEDIQEFENKCIRPDYDLWKHPEKIPEMNLRTDRRVLKILKRLNT